MIRGYIFDLDGTLLDSLMIWDHLSSGWLKKLGIEPEADLDRILFPMGFKEGSVYLHEHYQTGRTPQEIRQEITAIVADFYMNKALLKQDTAEVLKALQASGAHLAVATASEKPLVLASLKRNGVLPLFEAVRTCGEEGTDKHDPAVYLTVAAMMGLKPEECMVVEDSLTALKTASAAGFQTCGIYDAYSHEDQNLIREISDLYIGKGETVRLLLTH